MNLDTHRDLGASHARAVVWDRQGGRCALCWRGMEPDSFDAHHRQPRRTSDAGWCACNVLGLHSTCHTIAPDAVHQQPTRARELGLIVPTWDDPRSTALWVIYPWRLWSVLTCDGHVQQAPEGLLLPSGETMT